MNATMIRVILLQRHGARPHLNKAPDTLAEGTLGGPSLTVEGLPTLAGIGAELRKRYMCSAPPGAGDTSCLGGVIGSGLYDSSELHAESSGLQRTLQTAEVTLDALVPSAARPSSDGISMPIAVYSRADSTDYIIRGYTAAKCPLVGEWLSTWRDSEAYRSLSMSSLALRSEVGALLQAAWNVSGAVSLAEFWNAFDLINTWAGMNVSDDLLSRAGSLAAKIEALKFGREAGGAACGGLLLQGILERLIAPRGAAPQLTYYAVHYPTLLCVLAALNISYDSGREDDAWLGDALLPFGAVLAFELRSQPGDARPSVELWYYGGSNITGSSWGTQQGWRRLRLPCEATPEVPPGACASADELRAQTAGTALSDTAEWCAACHAGPTQTELCPAVPPVVSRSDNRSVLEVATVLLLVLLSVALLALVAVHFSRRRRAQPVTRTVWMTRLDGRRATEGCKGEQGQRQQPTPAPTQNGSVPLDLNACPTVARGPIAGQL